MSVESAPRVSLAKQDCVDCANGIHSDSGVYPFYCLCCGVDMPRAARVGDVIRVCVSAPVVHPMDATLTAAQASVMRNSGQDPATHPGTVLWVNVVVDWQMLEWEDVVVAAYFRAADNALTFRVAEHRMVTGEELSDAYLWNKPL